MTLEEAFYAHAVAGTSIASLIGTRLYPSMIPQDASLPAAAYQRVASTRMTAHDGATGHATATIQVTCQATTYSAANQVANAFIARFDGVKGNWGSGSPVEVFRCTVETDVDSFESPTNDASTRRVDLLVHYREA